MRTYPSCGGSPNPRRCNACPRCLMILSFSAFFVACVVMWLMAHTVFRASSSSKSDSSASPCSEACSCDVVVGRSELAPVNGVNPVGMSSGRVSGISGMPIRLGEPVWYMSSLPGDMAFPCRALRRRRLVCWKALYSVTVLAVS